MAEISAKLVMELRNETGLSMMECKAALQEANGDKNAAKDILAKKMKGKMDARTDRAAGEGRIEVAIADHGRAGAIVELRAETDFTAKNDNFVAAAKKIAALAIAQNPGSVTPTAEMNAIVDAMRNSTGENISLARVHKLEGGGNTMFGTYIHHDGKTGVLLQCEGSVSQDVAKDICMHITAAVPRPQGVSAADVPAELIERERRLAMEMAIEQGKNEDIARKMVEGKIARLAADLALLEQPWVKDPEKKIKDLVGKNGTVVAFLRWQVGESR